MSPRIALVLLFLVFSQAADAILPAWPSPYQTYCLSSADFVGTVEYAESHDCRLRAPSCIFGRGALFLKVKVNEVIRNQSADVHEGDAISTSIRVRNDPPKMIGGRLSRYSAEDTGTMDFALTGEPITDDQARSALVGQRLFFSLSKDSTGERNSSTAWRHDHGERLRRIWSTVCLRPDPGQPTSPGLR